MSILTVKKLSKKKIIVEVAVFLTSLQLNILSYLRVIARPQAMSNSIDRESHLVERKIASSNSHFPLLTVIYIKKEKKK